MNCRQIDVTTMLEEVWKEEKDGKGGGYRGPEKE
jgi:hypothetical protein